MDPDVRGPERGLVALGVASLTRVECEGCVVPPDSGRQLVSSPPLSFVQLEAEAPRLAEYQAYIAFEMKVGDPARVQLIFERALAENCLVPDLWIRYSQYLVR